MENKKEKYIWAMLRIGIGWIFLWPFLDKLFGLYLNTAPEKAWINGGSPTYGFLKFGTHGPFQSLFQDLIGSSLVDWIFMLGLLLIGLALIFGVLIKLASFFGSLMLLLMWLAVLPPEHNPFLDDHIIYMIVLIGISVTKAGRFLGFGEKWSRSRLVKKYPIFE